MKFACTADWHLSRYGNDSISEESGLPDRLNDIKKSMVYIAEYCIKNNIENVIVAGDILNDKSIIYAVAQGILLDYIREYKQLRFIIIDGNHDLSGKSKDAISGLKCLDGESNVHHINVPFERLGDILFVPYSNNMIDTIKNNSSKYLISHFGLNEGMLNSGISIKSDLKLRDLMGKYDYVLLGHYHRQQQIENDDIKLYYIGSVVELDWGERDEQKRFLIIDTDDHSIQSIPIIGYKKHILLELNNENKDEILSKGRQLKLEGHYVNIETKNKDVEIDNSMREEFKIIDKSEIDITQRGITSGMSMEEKLKRYLQIKGINIELIDKYINKAKDVILTCKEYVGKTFKGEE